MSSTWESSGLSFIMASSNITLTEIMEKGFVATSYSGSSPLQIEQWDLRSRPKSSGSPFLLKVAESTPMGTGGSKPWIGGEEVLSSFKSPLPPEAPVFELSSLASEAQKDFNNSIVGDFYGDKVSTPYKEEVMDESKETTIDVSVSMLQEPEVVVNKVGQHKSLRPMWEISEINSALEENTPSLDVSISDLRFQSVSDRETATPAQSSSYCAQWVGALNKDVGLSYLQPFRYQRQLSASEMPAPPTMPPPRSFHLSGLSSDDRWREWQFDVTTGTPSPAKAARMCSS
ncbi:uncharacterized protein O3C94_020254 [Discoglossus pictus]